MRPALYIECFPRHFEVPHLDAPAARHQRFFELKKGLFLDLCDANRIVFVDISFWWRLRLWQSMVQFCMRVRVPGITTSSVYVILPKINLFDEGCYANKNWKLCNRQASRYIRSNHLEHGRLVSKQLNYKLLRE